MYNPVATYRLQFHKEFSFSEFEAVIPYLQKLGVSAVYASPIFKSVPGSPHGYDALDPHQVNPEIGTGDQLKNMSKKLKENNIGWVQDIVPNHMAFHPSNKWLMDVLEKGLQSIYAPFFDIVWTEQMHKDRLMAPFLGGSIDEVIEKGDLKLGYGGARFVFHYFDNSYPLNPTSYEIILKQSATRPNQAIHRLLDQISQVKKIAEKEPFGKSWDEFLLKLQSLMNNKVASGYIQAGIEAINGNKDFLKSLADEQVYRLCHWQETDAQINYRRFFTVNGLICLNMQDKEVFQVFHEYIFQLAEAGIFQGLRIDHVDGLYNPVEYLENLREAIGEEQYIAVEKILQPYEALPGNWPVQGTTGYDFLALVNNLFTQKNNQEVFTQFYEDLVDDQRFVYQHIQEKKGQMLSEHMAGELENLYRLFLELNLVEKKAFASVHGEDLKNAISEFLIQCPVYRFYANHFPLQGDEADAIQNILNNIRRNNASLSRAIHLLEEALLKKPQEGNEERNENALFFYRRCMQFTGPLMAKGVEDTVMYTYNRFIGHNEVGDSPEAFGLTTGEFHQRMMERQERWPLSINTTATHDTKRGEDVRARLNVLSGLDDEWTQIVQEWRQLTRGLKVSEAPDVNDEYFLYQTLVGTFPVLEEDEKEYENRLHAYLEKAVREAKTYSTWAEPDLEYEEATKKFASGLLNKTEAFWKSFEPFHKKVSDFGMIHSLGQLLLKFTCPGLPDVYQGTELWDFNFVDPDNRRIVDYTKCNEWLSELEATENENLLNELWNDRKSAKIKLWLTQKLFVLRRQQPEFFLQALYMPVPVEGKYKDFVLAFARLYKQNLLLVAVPLHAAQLCMNQNKDFAELDWMDTKIILPHESSGEWENILSSQKIQKGKSYAVKDLFSPLPLALLRSGVIENIRNAGMLMHITSLPSAYGIGDMGKEAIVFADMLHRCHQKIWQLLPLNPTEAGQAHSPYSSISSRAGNTLLISPELLVKDELITSSELSQYQLPSTDKVNYNEAGKNKNEILEKAWQSFRAGKATKLIVPFNEFCQQEQEWLDDFAVYMVLKKQNDGKAWFHWEEQFKQKETEAIEQVKKAQEETIEKIKFFQFLFLKQWKELRAYCNKKNIQLLGDIPFYVSYDSADVWTHREIFALDDEGKMMAMAGTPPDAFSDEGQLWGMPVFRWEVLEEKNYDWWIRRLKKNIELFDLVRLDHFRAFADYWEVPAGDATAKNGQWKNGPSTDFFEAVKKALNELPFVAEDLGEINQAVFQLRDAFRLPGMKVLAFAFDEAMPLSEYIPHNYTSNFVAYTGTHDNNTIRGWYRKDADDVIRNRVQHYAGRAVNEDEVHIVLGRMAYASVAKTVILPVQDVLGLDENARMNTPSSAANNWSWRLLPNQFSLDAENRLKEWVWLFHRR